MIKISQWLIIILILKKIPLAIESTTPSCIPGHVWEMSIPLGESNRNNLLFMSYSSNCSTCDNLKEVFSVLAYDLRTYRDICISKFNCDQYRRNKFNDKWMECLPTNLPYIVMDFDVKRIPYHGNHTTGELKKFVLKNKVGPRSLAKRTKSIAVRNSWYPALILIIIFNNFEIFNKSCFYICINCV